MQFQGLEIVAYRSDIDGRIVVEIDTSELHESDTHPGGDAIPNIVLYVNESRSEIRPDGEWETGV